jgi:uncharacterized protein (DUF433 family)
MAFATSRVEALPPSPRRVRIAATSGLTLPVKQVKVSIRKSYDIIRVMETATNYRYIVKTEGIRGGNARIEGTRIGVHDVIGLLQSGETIDSVSTCFPDITRAQVYECLA